MSGGGLKNFLKLEAAGGVLLVMATVLALLISNSPLAGTYQVALEAPLVVALDDWSIEKPILLWINDGLMAVFFLLIGLEVKREILEGQLSSRDQLALPAIAATGGFLVPAAIYAFFNWRDPLALGGWAVPAATDIAFALGVLMLLGNRVPMGLKVFLTSLAIFDDLGAILVIAIFYSQDLSILSLTMAGIATILLIAMNRLGISRIAPFALVGIFIWACVLKSGVHATLAGIVVAMSIPLNAGSAETSPLRRLEHALHPWAAFGILPLFALANAGVSLSGVDSAIAFGSVSMGIALGLFVGKQLGVFASVWLAVKLRLARLPTGSTWLSIYGVSLLTGIGFTMSLFIGSLAFEHGTFDHSVATRVGVLAGSLMSALLGYAVLRVALRRPRDFSHSSQEGYYHA